MLVSLLLFCCGCGCGFCSCPPESREARQAGRGKPRRACPVLDTGMLLPKIPRPACEPNGFIVGRAAGWPFFWLLFFGHTKKSDSRVSASFNSEAGQRRCSCLPDQDRWVPTFAGMTAGARSKAPLLNPPLRCAQGRRPGAGSRWVPACAGMTGRGLRLAG